MSDKGEMSGSWPQRAIGLALLGAVLALAFERLMQTGAPSSTEDPLRLGAASFLAAAGLGFAFTLERVRPLWSLAFGLVAGTVVASVFAFHGTPTGWSAGEEWRLFSAALVVAVATPLFQTARDAGAARFAPEAVHAHAWTNAVLWAASWAFVLAAFLTALLLAELFHLVGIEFLRDTLRKEWFVALLIGGALGGAIGLLRDRDPMLRLLQRVATTVLSVLAPVLAAGLVLFVLSLAFTGLQPLWDRTDSTTPILLLAVAGAFFLTNAVIGNSAEEEAGNGVLRASAAALAAVMLPLAAIAALSMWQRVDQHGFTPERLWGLVSVAVVLLVAITYFWTLVAGRRGWSARLRPANVRLAMAVCAIALVLATPILNFGAISTRDQLARLESGRIAPEKFDWAALKFDFGPSGRQAVERLAQEGSQQVQAYARLALAEPNRFELQQRLQVGQARRARLRDVQVRPAQVPIPPALMEALLPRQERDRTGPGACESEGTCTLFWSPGETVAVAVLDSCTGRAGADENCRFGTTVLANRGGRWTNVSDHSDATASTLTLPELSGRVQRDAIARGDVQVREVRRRQLFVGDQPVGNAFE
jgi:hypothetical protein